ncbi:MAG: DeoR/GlpR family DNA-binding transcription regulator [Yersiniaceae bacterium]|uniref:Transcriptional regulator n=1 Tax=Chimaeribacter coloradensis TaxID=2060068 RepID=A0A2N5EB78_9GAMM|nr:DeoR/GlpR family DNA-binding transcription regulator [Chimaeribacter coloradensis]MDU6410238.1 DeoR/GlpR family DNA-binding transcription regulator [Yersiniaceae bacterium]PLR39370.1 transcriptional regulator [Chimaeribacter coloradensis]
MNSYERRHKIVDLVNQQGTVLVAELSDAFDVSEVTIRSDLRLLEERGMVLRFHGGAARPGDAVDNLLNEAGKEAVEVVLEDRYRLAKDPKKRIAQAAAAMVRAGDTVILDSGSTTMLIAEELVNREDITIITNNLPAAFVLSENKDITLVICGGTLRHKTRSMHGTVAESALQGISANLMFVGADGLDAVNGITTFNEGYSISGVMAKAAARVIAVTDASKFGRRGFNQVLPLAQIDTVITDSGIGSDDHQALAQRGMHVVIV